MIVPLMARSTFVDVRFLLASKQESGTEIRVTTCGPCAITTSSACALIGSPLQRTTGFSFRVAL
jgi:hypothetical protein